MRTALEAVRYLMWQLTHWPYRKFYQPDFLEPRWAQIGCRCGGHTNAYHITDRCTCREECDERLI